MFAPASAKDATEHLEALISDMANDKTQGWFMKAIQAVVIIAIVKDEPSSGIFADHRSVGIPNTLSKIVDKAILQPVQADYVKELIPHELGVGVKFGA